MRRSSGTWREEWDALAVGAGRPYCAPAWMLAWWRHACGEGPPLRAVVVLEGGRLLGIAPFWLDRRGMPPARHRLLGDGLAAPVEPLSAPGREREVADVVVSTLSRAVPAPVILRFEATAAGAGWAGLLVDGWSRRPWVHSEYPTQAPGVSLEGLDYDAWLATRSTNFRQQARRLRRRLEQAGAEFKIAGEHDLERQLSEFSRLHHARWDWRGGSDALDPGVERMLAEVGRELVRERRFRLVSIEIEGRVVSSHLSMAAGGQVSYWNGGFDQAWAPFQPSIQALLHTIRDATERGERHLDLGPGAQDYKRRMADGESVLAPITLVPRGRGYPVGRLGAVRYQPRWSFNRQLFPGARRRLRRYLRL